MKITPEIIRKASERHQPVTAQGYNLDIRDRVASSRFEVGSRRSLIPAGGYK